MGYRSQQQSFFKIPHEHRYAHGGQLRQKRAGRKARPLSCKESAHIVFKAEKSSIRAKSFRQAFNFMLVQKIIKLYAARFYVKVEKCSVQHDHIHLMIRTSRRSQFHHFFRVVAGQIAQQFEKEGLLAVTDTPKGTQPRATTKQSRKGKTARLWKYRPFSRVVRGRRNYTTTRDYIQLNEQEITGKIKYNKQRLRGLSSADWEVLWS